MKETSPQETINQLIHLYKHGQLALVAEQAQALTQQYPEAFVVWNILGAANKGLGRTVAALNAFKRVTELNPNYAEGHNNMGVALKDQGKFEEAIAAYNQASVIKPDYAEPYYNKGKIFHEQKNVEQAIGAYNKAIEIKADYVDAYYNKGIALHEQGKLEEAVITYNQALAIKPDHGKTYHNMGDVLHEQGKLEEAIAAYNKALTIKSDYAESYNNMGNVFLDQGKVAEAIKVYKKALVIEPNSDLAMDNFQSLDIQLPTTSLDPSGCFYQTNGKLSSDIARGPRYQIQNAIMSFIQEDFYQTNSYLNNFNSCDRKTLDKLNPKNNDFCNAYNKFLGKLSKSSWEESSALSSSEKVYHIGESHCLSYAHRHIRIDGSLFKIEPMITFGAKAYHFSRKTDDQFKAITRANFISVPKKSNLFISFGEIDCRPNEGFISAASKLNQPVGAIVDETALGYVKWFVELNKDQNHSLFFFNVPAPVYDKKYNTKTNAAVANTVASFNSILNNYVFQYGFNLIDVFKFTVGEGGFSNELFHIDNKHLDARAMPEIEQQLN
jgi:tetratricopeptide (TPR) repeat protein